MLDELSTHKTRLKNVEKELSSVKCQLNNSMDTESCLRQCVANLTELGDADRERRDKDLANLRGTVKRLEAELDAKREPDKCNANVELVKSAISNLVAEVKNVNLNSKTCVDELRAENAALTAKLSAYRAKALAAKTFSIDCESRNWRKFGGTSSSYRGEEEHEYTSSYTMQLERGDDDRQMICSTSAESTVTIRATDKDDDDDDDDNNYNNDVVPYKYSSVVTVNDSCDITQPTFSQNEGHNDEYDLSYILNKYGKK